MASMELLPGLNADQTRFAGAYHAVFEQLKLAMLLLSSLLLLRQGQAEGQTMNPELFQRVQAELDAAHWTWQEFEPPQALQGDYRAVRLAVDEMLRLHHGLAGQPDYGELSQLTVRISGLFQELRQIALRFWRLELVAESATHRH